MVKLKKSHIQIFSVLIALVFVGSCVAMALSQSGTGRASAGPSSNVGVIDYRQVLTQHPDLKTANETMQQEVEKAQQDFEAKSVNMNDQEKQEFYQQTQERLANKQQELVEPINSKIEAAVKAVADAKGLSVVIDKNAVVYGGQDITQDVIRKTAK